MWVTDGTSAPAELGVVIAQYDSVSAGGNAHDILVELQILDGRYYTFIQNIKVLQ